MPGLSLLNVDGVEFEVYVVDTRTSKIGVYTQSDEGVRLLSFEVLQTYLGENAIQLVFATNGGMFHSDYEPVGLLVQEGRQLTPLNLASGSGNFFLKPNGVFFVTSEGVPAIVTTEDYATLADEVWAATQSGPMLVIDGDINGVFQEDSPNRFVRSGVGIIDAHTVAFALSTAPVNFRHFARLFSETLGCKEALFLDGVISQFHVRGARQPSPQNFGVLIGVAPRSEEPEQGGGYDPQQ